MILKSRSLLLLSLSLLSSYALDQVCENGQKYNDLCCHSSCTVCGGMNCANSEYGPEFCCESELRQSNTPCSETNDNPPCIITTPDSECELGILSEDSLICCPESCTSCGIMNPVTEDEFWDCSMQGVIEGGRPCDEKQAPCIMQIGSFDMIPQADSYIRRSTVVGIYTNDMNYKGREDRYHTNIESALLFQDLDRLSMYTVKKLQDQGFYVQLVIELKDSFPNLDEIGYGKYDYKLKEFGRDAKNNGRSFSVRILHEFNDGTTSSGYSWNVIRNYDYSGEKYKKAFRHVVDVLRGTGAQLKYQMSYNNKSSSGVRLRLSSFYPGDSYVDEVCVSIYNRAFLDKWHTTYASFESLFDDTYYQLKSFTSRPICIGEMSATEHGDKVSWIKNTWSALTYKYTRVKTVNWFLYNKESGWDLNTQSQIDAWVNGKRVFVSSTDSSGDQAPLYVIETMG